jgi:ribonuclease Z
MASMCRSGVGVLALPVEARVATLHLLGTGAALSDADRTTTMLAVTGPHSVIVIDCGGDVVRRLLAHGIDLDRVEALVVTHEHADHVSGFPLMMERLWLAGRSRPLDVYGIAPAIDQVRRLHDAFDTSAWPGYPEVRYHQVALDEGASVLRNEDWEITASPGRHAVPVTGLRIRDVTGGGVMAYSADTEPSEAIERLASGADLLVHEATGDGPGHTGAADAARLAARAGVRRLRLVHIAPGRDHAQRLLGEARAHFPDVALGSDGDTLTF